MNNKNFFKEETETNQALKTLAFAYEQISVMKMGKVRKSVIKAREFLEALEAVYFDVKINYDKTAVKISANSGKLPAAVLLSANQSAFSGDINARVYKLFLEFVKKNQGIQAVVIGRQGKAFIERDLSLNGYIYFDMPEGEADFESLKDILSQISKFSPVEVFFGKFNNVYNQLEQSLNISGNESFWGGHDESTHDLTVGVSSLDRTSSDPGKPATLQSGFYRDKHQSVAYKFEPAIGEIMDFFLSQVKVSLFKQAVHESELARHGSRIKAMEDALSNLDIVEKKLKKSYRKFNDSIANKKQLQAISGISLWGQ